MGIVAPGCMSNNFQQGRSADRRRFDKNENNRN